MADEIDISKPRKSPPTAERLRQILDYDPDTGCFTHKRGTGRCRIGAVAGTRSGPGYWGIAVDGVKYGAHRLAWLYMTGKWPALEIDHIDRDKTNNRWSNLRQVTRTENQMNKSPKKNGVSRFIGVSYCRRGRKWVAQIGVNHKHYSLGRFDVEADAAKAYLAAKPLFHKIRGRPNKPF